MNDIVATLYRQESRRVFSTLARVLHVLLPEPEVRGLLALLLRHDARRAARNSAAGELVPLDEPDRTLWNRDAITEGCALAEAALSQPGFGAYALQAAIAALHGEAASTAATDWAQIVGLYDALLRVKPSPVIGLNRGVAVAMRDGPETGLALIEPLLPPCPATTRRQRRRPTCAAALAACTRPRRTTAPSA